MATELFTNIYGENSVIVILTGNAETAWLEIIIADAFGDTHTTRKSMPQAIADTRFWIADTFEIMECHDLASDDVFSLDLDDIAAAAMLTKQGA